MPFYLFCCIYFPLRWLLSLCLATVRFLGIGSPQGGFSCLLLFGFHLFIFKLVVYLDKFWYNEGVLLKCYRGIRQENKERLKKQKLICCMNYEMFNKPFVFKMCQNFRKGLLVVSSFKEFLAFLGRYIKSFSFSASFASHFPSKGELVCFYCIFKCKFSLFLSHKQSPRMILAET